MAELEAGPHEVDVEQITVKGIDGVAVDAVHARPDGMPIARDRPPPRHHGVASPVRRPVPATRHARLRRVRARAIRSGTRERARGRRAERPHGATSQHLDDDVQIGDLEAAADYLVVHDDVREVSVVGFCMGGMQALKAAASGRFDKAVAFYGMVRVPERLGRSRRSASPSTPLRRCARRSRSSAASTR